MSFIDIIKKQMLYDRRRAGAPIDKVVVNRKELDELVERFERLDSAVRADDHLKVKDGDLYSQLHFILQALYKKDRDGEMLMLCIMDTLKPLIEERVKERPFMKLKQANKTDQEP